MKPEELEIGNFYFYQGTFLKPAYLRYAGSVQTYYGTGYQFERSIYPDWIVGNQYKLSADGLKDILPLTSTEITGQVKVL